MVGANAGRRRIGPFVSVPDAMVVDHLWVQLHNGVEVDTHTLRDAASITVEDDVGLLDKLGEDLFAFRGERVDSDALLTLCDAHRRRLRHRSLEPDRIAPQRFDLDDPGALVGEHRAPEWPCVEGA